MHVIRCRSAECLPFPMIAASFLVSAQWLLYGFILNDLFITVSIMGRSLLHFSWEASK